MSESRAVASTPAETSPKAGRWPARRLIAVLATVVLTAALLSFAITWWRDRPLAQANAALDAGRPVEALRIVNELLRSRPGDGPASAVKARALVAVGRFREAAALFEKHGAATDDELHAFAKALLAIGRWESARPLLERYVRRNPSDADALHELTACYAKLGKLREALATAAEFAKQPGQEARGQLLIGTIQRDSGNERQAADAYARVLELRPDADDLQVPPAEFLHAYAQVLLDLGEPGGALPLLERSLSIAPTTAAYADLGRAQEQLGRTEDAVKAWRSALALDPGDRTAREGLAGAALGGRDAVAAIDLLTPLSAEPAASTAYLLQRAYALSGDAAESARWKDRADALRSQERLQSTVQKVLTESPDSPWAAALRAYRSAEQGQWAEAEKHLAAAPAAEPFVTALREAVRRRGPLPPLSDLPISRF